MLSTEPQRSEDLLKGGNVPPISSNTGTTEMRYLRLKAYSSKVRKSSFLTNSERKIVWHIHTGHKNKHRAGHLFFWPEMGKQIKAKIEECNIYQERHRSNIPERPWQVVGTDPFTWWPQDFVIIV